MLVDAPHVISLITFHQQVCNLPYFKEPPQTCYTGPSVRTPGIQASEKESALHAIQDFAKLEKDWDGYGALPIHETCRPIHQFIARSFAVSRFNA